jgi:hypothetical protein
MFKRLQIHFFPPCLGTSKKAHAKQIDLVSDGELLSTPIHIYQFQELNFMEDRNSSHV